MNETMRATVPRSPRSTKKSLATSAPSSTAPPIHNERRPRRVAKTISASAHTPHNTEVLPWNVGERCSSVRV